MEDGKCDGRDNAKQQCSCISILIKKKRKQHEGYYRDFYCLLLRFSKIKYLKKNKTRKIRFSVKVDF